MLVNKGKFVSTGSDLGMWLDLFDMDEIFQFVKLCCLDLVKC